MMTHFNQCYIIHRLLGAAAAFGVMGAVAGLFITAYLEAEEEKKKKRMSQNKGFTKAYQAGSYRQRQKMKEELEELNEEVEEVEDMSDRFDF